MPDSGMTGVPGVGFPCLPGTTEFRPNRSEVSGKPGNQYLWDVPKIIVAHRPALDSR
jgi:hypothetical protein